MEILLQRTFAGWKYPHIHTLSITIQSRIRVRKHSGKIYSNFTVQVHYYHTMWSNIRWIIHHWIIQKYELQEINKIWNWKMLPSWIEISRVWYRRWIWKIIWYVPKLLPGSDPGTCYTSSMHFDQQQELTNVQALESRYADPGFLEYNPTST